MTPENCHSLVQNRDDHLIQLCPVMILSYLKILIYNKRLRLPTLPESILVMIWWQKFIVVMNRIGRWKQQTALEGMLESLVLQCLYHAVYVNHKLYIYAEIFSLYLWILNSINEQPVSQMWPARLMPQPMRVFEHIWLMLLFLPDNGTLFLAIELCKHG